jgi:hypothetical protein
VECPEDEKTHSTKVEDAEVEGGGGVAGGRDGAVREGVWIRAMAAG